MCPVLLLFKGFQPQGILLFPKKGKDGPGERKEGDGPSKDFTGDLIWE